MVFSNIPDPVELVYVGGDTVAFVASPSDTTRSLYFFHSPVIASPP